MAPRSNSAPIPRDTPNSQDRLAPCRQKSLWFPGMGLSPLFQSRLESSDVTHKGGQFPSRWRQQVLRPPAAQIEREPSLRYFLHSRVSPIFSLKRSGVRSPWGTNSTKNSSESSYGDETMEYARSNRFPSCSTPNVAYCPAQNSNVSARVDSNDPEIRRKIPALQNPRLVVLVRGESSILHG